MAIIIMDLEMVKEGRTMEIVAMEMADGITITMVEENSKGITGTTTSLMVETSTTLLVELLMVQSKPESSYPKSSPSTVVPMFVPSAAAQARVDSSSSAERVGSSDDFQRVELSDHFQGIKSSSSAERVELSQPSTKTAQNITDAAPILHVLSPAQLQVILPMPDPPA
ncbi:hypothetical protein Ddye_017904 [Dipteronia dyeriana]|uniref:Uncharacterized protein n=1 Tax=Dipteronia dyeriana TaxID=168575 RepID=A0AAD9X1T3_9ROSI|nr:hypothetical protein Ddye_017904 [Dipteronia dyeriana]